MKKQPFERTSIYKRLYGKTLSEMASDFNCSIGTILKRHKDGELKYLQKKDAIGYIDKRIVKIWNNAWSRCNMPEMNKYEYYGGRGIKCELSPEDVVYLWKRDGADKMECPSLDRIDSEGNYNIKNCRFIEFKINRKLRNSFYATDLLISFFKSYKTLKTVERIFKVDYFSIIRLVNKKKCGIKKCKEISLKIGIEFDKCFKSRE